MRYNLVKEEKPKINSMMRKYKLLRGVALALLLCGVVALQAQSAWQPSFGHQFQPADATATNDPAAAQLPATLPANLLYETATPGLDGAIIHTVLEGQFLINIAELYGVPLADLMANNNLTADSIIYPGDQLIIFKGGEINLGLGTPTAVETLPVSSATPTAPPTATFLPQLVSETALATQAQPGLTERLFSGNARWLALGVIGLVLLGLVLVVVSSHRIQ